MSVVLVSTGLGMVGSFNPNTGVQRNSPPLLKLPSFASSCKVAPLLKMYHGNRADRVPARR
jgi:hypothetical protein